MRFRVIDIGNNVIHAGTIESYWQLHRHADHL